RRLSGTGYYNANQLYLTISKDENWVAADGKAGTIEEYKDKEGKIILKRMFNRVLPANTIETLSTYYVYDDLGKLSFVLPPGANPDATSVPTQVTLDNFCYQYRYNGRDLIIEKKFPGKGWEYSIYNKLNQLVFSQDTIQKTAGRWFFNKYDGQGRTIITGMHTNAASRAVIQSTVDTLTALFEVRDDANIGGTLIGYTNRTLPKANLHSYHTVEYYDDYNFYNNTFGGPSGPASGQVDGDRTKGLLTGNYIAMLDGGMGYLSTYYYDEEGQLLLTKKQNHLNKVDFISNSYNFLGELTKNTYTHDITGIKPTTITTDYQYDHIGRQTKTYKKINGNVQVLLSEQIYNEIGQLKDKRLNNSLLSIAYRYNERGWLTRATSPQFSMTLGYDTLATAQYNGNIAMQRWGTGGISYPNAFSYTYDKLNRLTNAISTGIVMSEALTYNEMGNITTLNRDGGGIAQYSYSGNRLTNVSGGGLTTANYIYDGNGNATTDGRNAVTLTYNGLNLPATLNKAGVLSMIYSYDATGRKLRKQSNMEGTIDYIDHIQYTGGTLDFIITEEGRARRNDTTFVYEYDLKDHLGNTRYGFSKHPTLNQVQKLQEANYYAFGKLKLATAGVNKYLYNGKELQLEIGQLDYGARFYDPEIARWNVVDPLADLYESISPYQYANNNPTRFVDPDGRGVDEGINLQEVVIVGHRKKENNFWRLHAALDLIGFIPVIGDLGDALNATIYLAEGDYANAALSAISIIPVVGDAIGKGIKVGRKVAKLVDEGHDLLKYADEVGEGLEGVYEITTKSGKKYVGQSKNVSKRLKQHSKSSKFKSEEILEVKVTEVKGGKLNREIVEQQKLNHESIGGRDGAGVLNKVNPLGTKRAAQEYQQIPTGATRTLSM
ncbi:MAG TPA: RHS repeat-associated core domain-containing protein, partial [Pedobacter sp.]|nr:RHS repeat-associated core domain-containing protein [Pedobacter sp.]